jgi:hypothetical protein
MVEPPRRPVGSDTIQRGVALDRHGGLRHRMDRNENCGNAGGPAHVRRQCRLTEPAMAIGSALCRPLRRDVTLAGIKNSLYMNH